MQSVVNGTVDVDMFVVQRYYRNNNLKIVERNLGEKDSFISMDNAGVLPCSSYSIAIYPCFL